MSVHSTALPATPRRTALQMITVLLLALWSIVSLGCAELESITPPPGAPKIDLSVENVADFGNRNPGEQVVFTVTVRNRGPVVATGIIAGDTIPSGLTLIQHETSLGSYATSGASRGRWDVGTLAVNASATLTLTARVEASAAGTTVLNRAGVLSSDMNDTVAANNIADATVTVAGTAPPPPPPPVGVFFSSNWSTDTGSTDNAITDGGRWNGFYCQDRAQTLKVVRGSSVGWTRTPNVLRFTQLGLICGGISATNFIPVSTSHYGRMYFRNDETGTQHNHVMTYNALGDIQTAFWNRGATPGNTMRIFMRTYYYGNGQGTAYPFNFWSPATFLPNGVWYRFEWHMEYVTPTSYRLWPRVYDMAGTLLHDANTYLENDAPAGSGRTLAAWYGRGNTFGFSNVQLARNLGLGNEGVGGSPSNGQFWYHASFAVSTSGWIGQ